MAYFGKTRNIETSLFDYLKDNLKYYNFEDVSVAKSFRDSEVQSVPFIICEIDNEFDEKIELGSNSTISEFNTIINVYGKSRGNSRDIKDFIKDLLKEGFPTYEYMISGGREIAKIPYGKINTKGIIRTTNSNASQTNLASLDKTEQFRFRIVVPCIDMGVDKSKYIPKEDNKVEQIYIYKIAGENLNAYDVVTMLSDEFLYRANYTSDDLSNAIGLSSGNFLKDSEAKIIVFGEVENLAWSWKAGKTVFLDNEGRLTQDSPMLSPLASYVIKVGTATANTKIIVKPSLEKLVVF